MSASPVPVAPRLRPRSMALLGVCIACSTLLATSASAQITAYGVTANGTLFRFDPANAGSVTTIGNLGVVPEAIDFRPGTGQLYAIDVGPSTTQVYTVSTATGAVSPVGAGFPSSVAGAGGYTLSGPVGFDFNPRTLQADTSVRIRVTGTNGTNLRLNSDTGVVAAVDSPLLIGTDSPFVDASAYINSARSTAAAAGTTTLYAMDSRNDALYIQNPPNNGTLNLVGPFGATIDANVGIGFDIFSATSTDDSLADESAFAVLQRPGVSGGGYLLYDVNLGTGQITNGRAVGGGLDFTGGFAVIPEPIAVTALAAVPMLLGRRRTR